jgi:dipeptidyl aminopeptidase/acylaminoacyl peptidase
VRAFAEAPDGAFAVLGKVHDDAYHSYDQMDVLRFAGAWPMREPVRLNATRDHAFGEGLSGDQHPPRGGGDLPFAFDADGRSLVTLATREGAALLVRVDGGSGKLEELTPADRDVVCGTTTPDSARWALTIGSQLTPGDVVMLERPGNTRRTLHAPNDALLGSVALGQPHELRVRSFDGTMIHGWYLTPPDHDGPPLPLILQIHGGPHAAYGHAFFHEFHVLAGAGYAVLFINPRGSTSYGEAFADMIQYRYPGDDYHDLMAAVDALIERGVVDPKRLGVTGGSGGGLLTNWVIAKTNRFAAAATQRCVSDWTAMAWSSDFAFFTPFWFRRQPWENPEEWLERSPVRYAADVTTPLMVIHSEEDWRTPIAQGEAMFRALKQQGKTAVMIRFPGENHELTRSGFPMHRVQNQQHLRAWFDHWLHGVPAPQYGV